MTLLDLINHVGLENITLQPLERDLHGLDTSKKHGCTIVKFGTEAITPGDIVTDNPKRKVGFVIWIPKERIPVSGTSVPDGNENQAQAPISQNLVSGEPEKKQDLE